MNTSRLFLSTAPSVVFYGRLCRVPCKAWPALRFRRASSHATLQLQLSKDAMSGFSVMISVSPIMLHLQWFRASLFNLFLPIATRDALTHHRKSPIHERSAFGMSVSEAFETQNSFFCRGNVVSIGWVSRSTHKGPFNPEYNR